MDLNYVGSLISGFFSIINAIVLQDPQLVDPQIQTNFIYRGTNYTVGQD